MPDTGKDYKEPAEDREDLARQTAEATKIKQTTVDVEAAGADALVESAAEDRTAAETNEAIEEARAPVQAEVDRLRAEREGIVEPDTGATDTGGAAAGDDYDSRTLDDLRDQARSRDLAVSGNKDEVVARLRDHDQSQRNV